MTIDHRKKIKCACGCQREASLPFFRIVVDGDERYSVLPACEGKFREKLAASSQLIDMVRARHPWPERARRSRTIFNLHRAIGRSRTLAFRGAMIFALPKSVGNALGKVWRF